MDRTKRTSIDETRRKIQNILALSQSSQNSNDGNVPTVSTSKQKNNGKREPYKKRDGRKKVAVPRQKNETTTAEQKTSKLKSAGRRGRKNTRKNVNDEKPPKRYEPSVNSRITRSKLRNASKAAALNAESNEKVVKHSKNEQEKENYHLSEFKIVINRLTSQQIENLSKVHASENDEKITSQPAESQQQLSVVRIESFNDELETQAIQETAENSPEQMENNDMDTNESHRQQIPARGETGDEKMDYLQMTMTSEEEEDNDEMPDLVSDNGSQHNSMQTADSGYQTGKKSVVKEWLNRSLTTDSLIDAADVPDDPVLPEHDIILNVCTLNQMPSNLPALITESMFDKEKDSVNAFDHQSQISTNFSGTLPKSIDNMSVASTHFSEESELEHEPISQMPLSADARSNLSPVHMPNLNKSISNATTHFSEGEEKLERNISTLSIQVDNCTLTDLSLNRPISVENVSNVSSPECSRDEEELETIDIADKQNASQETVRPQLEIQFSRPDLQPVPKRRKIRSVIGVPCGNSEPNRRIVSQPIRHRPEFDPNDFQHSSQPLALVRARFRPSTQNNNNDNNSLLIATPSDTDYQESNRERFITQPTQQTHMNWGFSRNSSLETILATNTSNVSAIPKYVYNRYQVDPTCFPMVPHTYYTSLVIDGETTFAVNDFDHGNANITHHFLSRFNDSLRGLSQNFTGIVYTTRITANLISYYMNVDRSRIKILEFNETVIVEGIKVTALELTSWPGATLFAFDMGSNGIILHVGDLRIPADTEGIEYLVLNTIRKFYFDRTCLERVYYQIPNDIDRYIGLIDECTKYIYQNNTVGMVGMIVIGAFKHGMESLILRLAEMFHMKVFMDLERCQFLDRMLDNDIQAEDSVHYRLRERVVDNPRKANIHILDVENINETYLMSYLSNGMNASFNRILAIRPRGNGSHDIQLALNKFIKILDIPNPLIGDYYEYRRFVESVRENPEPELRQRQLQ